MIKKALIAASALALANAASAATMSLQLVYLGYQTTNISQPASSLTPTDPTLANPAGSVNLNDAAIRNSANRHVFKVQLVFNGQPNSSEDFRSIAFDSAVSGGLDKINRAGTTTFSANGTAFFMGNLPGGTALSDAGFDGNFAFYNQTDPGVAYTNALGEGSPYTLGYAFVRFNASAGSDPQTITLSASNGANFSYFTGNDDLGSGTVVTTAAGVTSGSFTFPATGPIPEPASLSLAALGGLALVRRRRA